MIFYTAMLDWSILSEYIYLIQCRKHCVVMETGGLNSHAPDVTSGRKNTKPEKKKEQSDH